MSVSPKEFEELIQIARKYGVTNFKAGEYSCELTNVVQFEETSDKHFRLPPVEGELTEDQMLLYSTPFMPDHKGE